MRTKHPGFTIVELLIVIVIIAILAAITIVAYNGVNNRASNSSRVTELRNYQKLFELYRTTYGSYPTVGSYAETSTQVGDGYCLGVNFPNGKCRDSGTSIYSYDENNASYMNVELRKAGSLPSGIHTSIGGTVGPWITRYSDGVVSIANAFQGVSYVCPSDMRKDYSNASRDLTVCAIALN